MSLNHFMSLVRLEQFKLIKTFYVTGAKSFAPSIAMSS